ncbi:MAG: hypothetical protein US85_C0016G0011 [Candidatus Shapirobacteria bacterium GW2011_GWF1_38_23]|nr:MAG: hypothetical protein US85_C0016G0011 [Candidatus Shapirobacteria bacterium GW2011_GWF1_38_23]
MITTREDIHNGVTYRKIESNKPVEGVIAFDREKLVLSGRPAIEVMENSYKFGNQIQITLFNRAGSIRRRPRVEYAGKYDRIEIFFDREEFKTMCEEFLKI